MKHTEPFKYRRKGAYCHTGKHDYDDCCTVGNNPTKKRTMRRIKKKVNRELNKFLLDN